MMGNPGLLQELPDIPPLLSQGGRDREQATAADGTARRLDAMTDFVLNDRLSQRSFNGVIGGFEAVDFQERPKGFSALQKLPAGTHRLGPRRSLDVLAVQIHPHTLQCGLKRLADRAATLLQLWPLDRSVLPLVPLL